MKEYPHEVRCQQWTAFLPTTYSETDTPMKPIYPMLAAVLIFPIGALAEEDKTIPQPPAKTPADNSGKNERDRAD